MSKTYSIRISGGLRVSSNVANALERGGSALRINRRKYESDVALPLVARNTEASPRAGDDPHRERLWRHTPSALPNSGGARTRACRVATLGDASGFQAARGSDTSGERSLRERLWRHQPSAMPNSGGARTPACRVGTPADTQLSGSPEASAPAYFQWFAGSFVESVAAARRSACATSNPGHHRRSGERFVASVGAWAD